MPSFIQTRPLAVFPILLSFAVWPTALAQSWVQLQPQGTAPPGRFNNTAVYDSITDRLIIFGGFTQATCCVTTNDVWVLTGADGHGGPRQWANLIPAPSPGAPPPTAAASAVYDSATNQMIVFGGQNGSLGTSSGDLYILKNANGSGGSPVWSKIVVSGAVPPARQNHQAVYDPVSNRMIVVGGLQFNGTRLALLNDVWVLTNANGSGPLPRQWTQLELQGAAPTPRHAFAAAYDEQHNRLSIFGGCVDAVFSCDNLLASTDLWVLSNANGTGGPPAWQSFQFTLSPPAHAQYAAGAYDPETNQLFVMGGRIGSLGTFGVFSDLTWVLSHANGLDGTPEWTMLSTGRSPAPRGQSVPPNLFDAAAGRIIVFGGPGLNDTWTLSTKGHGGF